MSTMNVLSITLIALILGAMLALIVGVQAASAMSLDAPIAVTDPATAL